LNAVSRATLFELPETHEDAQRRYAMTPDDIALAKGHRRSHNRLGFAVQIALVRDLGRPLRAGEAVPGAVPRTNADARDTSPQPQGSPHFLSV